MRNKTMRFLTASLIFVIAVCVVLFTALGIYMNQKSENAIDNVGSIYMSGLNERISKHFETIITTQLSYLESVTREVPPDSEDVYGKLSYSIEARDFNYIALYDNSGAFHMIYGEHIKLADPEPFLESMKNNEKKIAVGTTDSDDDVVIIGIPAAYTMADGEKSLALVAGLPVSYIKTILSLDDENSMVYSHVIRKDGSFVIKSADAFRENYFDRIRVLFGVDNPQAADEHIEELQKAMVDRSDYSSIFNSGTERRHVYCTALPYSEWYLVTVMPYGTLDEVVNDFSTRWIILALASCALL